MSANIYGLDQPEDLDSKIWRYMSLEKFRYLLALRSLYFARADRFADPFEGSLTQPAHTGFLIGIDIHGAFEDGTPAAMSEIISNMARGQRTKTYLNCWHLNQVESVAMWKLYGAQNKAIAVQATYRRLWQCLPDNVHLGRVRYIDYSVEQFPHDSWLLPFFHKRNSYEYEREVRAAFVDHTAPGTTKPPSAPEGHEHVDFEVDIRYLIESIYVSPFSAVELQGQVEKLVHNSGLACGIHRSRLEEKPVF